VVRRPALPPRRRTHRWRPAAWSRSARGTTDHRGSAGVLKGAPLSAVHAETADLLIPATAEIAAVRRPQRDRDRSCGASRPPVRDGLSVVRRPVASRWPCRRPAPAPRHRWRWALAALLFAGFVAVIASVGRSTLSGTGSALRHLDWAWIPPALVAEFTSMTAFARAQRRLLRGGGIDLRFVSVVAVTYAGNAISVSLPVAGPEVGTAFAFHQFRRRGADLATASWALVVSGLISSFAFALVVAGGAIASGSGSAAAMGLAMATLALTPIVAFLLALRYQAARRFINHMTTPVVKSLNRLRKRPETGPVPAFDSFLDRLASIKLPGLHYAEVVLLLGGRLPVPGLYHPRHWLRRALAQPVPRLRRHRRRDHLSHSGRPGCRGDRPIGGPRRRRPGRSPRLRRRPRLPPHQLLAGHGGRMGGNGYAQPVEQRLGSEVRHGFG